MKLAIIGSYGHVGLVLNGLEKLPDVALAAAARWGPDDPLAFVGTRPAAPGDLPVYDDYCRMLDEVRPELVGVFLPLYRNAEASIAAAERGAHVVSEKPLATTLAGLSALREAVSRAGVRIAALLGMRGDPPYQAIRRVVADGRIGEPVLAFGQKSYPFAGRDDFYKRRETYGGSIPWAAIHALDFVSYCAGKDYARVAAVHSNAAHPTHPGMEDAGAILLDFAGGGHAAVTFDYLRPWSDEVRGQRDWGDERLRIAPAHVRCVHGGAASVRVDHEQAVVKRPVHVRQTDVADGRRGEPLHVAAQLVAEESDGEPGQERRAARPYGPQGRGRHAEPIKLLAKGRERMVGCGTRAVVATGDGRLAVGVCEHLKRVERQDGPPRKLRRPAGGVERSRHPLARRAAEERLEVRRRGHLERRAPNGRVNICRHGIPSEPGRIVAREGAKATAGRLTLPVEHRTAPGGLWLTRSVARSR